MCQSCFGPIMSTYLIGDVQGCYRELCLLLERINFGSADQLWLLGDLVNRGPENAAVLDLAIDSANVHAILGNHDLHFLAVAMGQQTPKRKDTIGDLLESTRRHTYVDYLRHRPLTRFFTGEPEILLVHAGVPAIFTSAQIKTLSAEVEHALSSDACEDFLQAMYGNSPAVWSDSLTGHERLRVITNYFTRLRYCTAGGEMELTHKAEVAPRGYAPWFTFPRQDKLRIFFGHWAALKGECEANHAEALDTGCVWGGALTALRLGDDRRFSVAAENRT